MKENTLHVLVVEPLKMPYPADILHTLSSMQNVVGGAIQAVYPFEDAIAVVCNDDGKLTGLQPNRILRDENGTPYDYLAGTFFVCGLREDCFVSLPPDMEQKYKKHFCGEMLLPKIKTSEHKRANEQER